MALSGYRLRPEPEVVEVETNNDPKVKRPARCQYQ